MKNRLVRVLTLGLCVVMLAGCGAAKSDSANYMNAAPSMKEVGDMYYAEAADESALMTGTNGYEGSDYNSSSNSQVKVTENSATDRKLIKNVNLEVETKEYEALMGNLEAQINSFGGYIENMDSYNGSNYSGRKNTRYANLTIRIPQNNLYEFLTTVSEACNVIRRSDNVNDVTLSYVDTKSRKDALLVEQERLLSILKRAEDLDTILVLEDRLTSVRYQLDSLESQLRSIDDKVTYSTVYLNVSEVQELTPVVIEEPTTWERIQEGFAESLDDVIGFFRELGVWFLINIPKIIVWAVIFVIGFVIFKITGKKRKAKKASAIQKVAESVIVSDDNKGIKE